MGYTKAPASATTLNHGDSLLQVLLDVLTPLLLPALLLPCTALVLETHAPLHPLLTAHLTESAQRPRKGEALLVAREDGRVLQHAHVHAQVVHQVPHHVVHVLAALGLGVRRLVRLVDRLRQLLARQEQLRQRHRRREHQLGARLVHGVDEGDEPPRQIPLPVRHPGHIRDDEGVIASRQLNVIRRARRPAYYLIEGEHGCLATDFGNVDVTTPDVLCLWVRWVMVRITQEAEPLLGVCAGVGVQGSVVHSARWARDLAVVGRRVKVDDM